MPCHLTGSYGKALTYWRWIEDWLHPFGLWESPPNPLPTSLLPHQQQLADPRQDFSQVLTSWKVFRWDECCTEMRSWLLMWVSLMVAIESHNKDFMCARIIAKAIWWRLCESVIICIMSLLFIWKEFDIRLILGKVTEYKRIREHKNK